MVQEQDRHITDTSKEQDWFNTKQVSAMLSLSNNVIRKMTALYRDQLSDTLKKGKKNSNLFNSESLYRLRKIRELSLNGFTQKQIKEQLLSLAQVKLKDQAQQGSTKIQSNYTELSHHKRVVMGSLQQVKLKTILRQFRTRLAQLEENKQNLTNEIDDLKAKNQSIELKYNDKFETMQKQIDLLSLSWWDKFKLKIFKSN